MKVSTVPNASFLPPWIQSIQYTLDTLGYLTKAERRCGRIFNAPVIGHSNPLIFVSDPQAVEQIFRTDTQEIIAPCNPLLMPVVGDRSLFSMERAPHRRTRKLMMPPFQRDHVPIYGELIQRLTEERLAQVPPGTVFSARDLARDISLDVILRVVFGVEDPDMFRRLRALITQLTALFRNPWVSLTLFQPSLQKNLGANSPWGKFLQVKQQISEILFRQIRNGRRPVEDQRRQQVQAQTANDILSLLIRATDEQGDRLTDQELHDELLTLLLAGHETTASSIAWALYWIHRDRRIYQRLMDELQNADSATTAPMALPYLNAVSCETLRIYPVAVLSFPRETHTPVNLMGYEIPPKTRLYVAIHLLHHNPELYPDPQVFRPERFLERQYSTFEFIPFGGGARRCLGETLARFELKLIIATLLKAGRFTLAEQTPEVPKRRGVTFAPNRGVCLVYQP